MHLFRMMMKLFRYIIIALAAVSLLSCRGQEDDAALPVLSVNDSEIDLASETQAVFTVTLNGRDVTDASSIYSTTSSLELQDNVFMPDRTGSHTFVAEYDGAQSNTVQVNVIDSTPEVVESKYDRHVCVMEFTGGWCINCPTGYDNMKGILAHPQLAAYKENIHICAFHSDMEGRDDFAIAETQDVFKLCSSLFAADLAYPAFATDLRVVGVLTGESVSTFRPSIESAFTEYLPHCGAAVASVMNEDKTSAEVTVKVASEQTSEYRVIVLVVQDKIIGWQITNYPDPDEPDGGTNSYNHRHVVRKVVTTYAGTFTGEKLTSDGKIAAGEEASKTWTVDVAQEWVLENTEIYALVLDSEGFVNNMNVCAIDGGDSGYDIK